MSNTAKTQLCDSNHGGTLFILPREIRDEIYRLLVKGRYLADKPLNQYGYSNCEDTVDTENEDLPDFSVLRVSKVLSHEAKEILYFEGVFRFVINFHHPRDTERDHENLDRLEKVAPLMMNVVLDIEAQYIEIAEWFYSRHSAKKAWTLERSFGPTIGLFGDLDIKRRSLLLRFLQCSTALTLWNTPASQIFWDSSNRRSTLFSAMCQRLKTLVSFRVATVEVMLNRVLLEAPEYYGFDISDQSRSASELVCRITHTLTEQLKPAFGPATFSLKSHARKMPFSEEKNLLHLDEVGLVGFLEFHPGKHSVKKDVAETNQGSEEQSSKSADQAKS